VTSRLDRFDRLAVGALVLAAAVTAAVYSKLPARIPTHWDIHGEPDGFRARAVGAWIAIGIGAALWIGTRLAVHVLPAWSRRRLAGTPVSATCFLLAAFFAALQIAILHAALTPGFTMSRTIAVLTGTMWMALGQLLPRMRRNPLFGIRTAWTLTSDENWLRTHRMGGYAMSIGGAVALVSGLFAGREALAVALLALIGSALSPVVYSFVLARSLPPPPER
jgi:uncharacterized membrane protein